MSLQVKKDQKQISPEPSVTNQIQQEQKIQSQPWVKYENSQYELPNCLSRSIPTCYYSIRWTIVSPFHIRVYRDISVGEILFFSAVIAFTIIASVISLGIEERGGASSLPLAFMLMFSMRNSFATFLFGISFERQLLWHKLLTYSGCIIGTVHWLEAESKDGDDDEKLTGEILLFTMFAMIVISQTPLRRLNFTWFLRFHIIGFCIVFASMLLHEAGVCILGGIGILFDFFLRAIIVCMNRKNASKATLKALPGQIIEISFPKKDLKYKAGGYFFVCIPKNSYFEWQPFSISSSPHEDNITMHVKVLGDWTRSLYKMVEGNQGEMKDVSIYLGGPYGTPCVNIDSDKYSNFLMFSGGVGITPMKSISESIYSQHKRGRKLDNMELVWSIREKELIETIYGKDFNKVTAYSDPENNPILPADSQQNPKFIKNFYLTKEKQIPENEQQQKNYNLNCGRPNLDEIFQNFIKKVNQDKQGNNKIKVAVLACGPSALVDQSAALAQKYSGKDGVQFDYHSELFEF